MINKKGFGFLIFGIGGLLLTIIVLTLILIFNQTFQSTISMITEFFKSSMLYIIIGVGLIIGYKVGIIQWTFALIKTLFRKIGL